MIRVAPAARPDGGFTLVEVLVAMAVFATAMLGLNFMLIGTMRSHAMTQDLATARFLAVHRMEQVIGARYLDGNRDAFLDTSDPCTDLNEVVLANFPVEDYGEVDLLNGTAFVYQACVAVPDIKRSAVMIQASDYAGDAQGRLDREVNREQYARFRREVYIVDSALYSDAIVNVSLDGPAAEGLDNVVVATTSPTAQNPATNYSKHVLVRVKWKDIQGQPHAVTLSSEKSFLIPAS